MVIPSTHDATAMVPLRLVAVAIGQLACVYLARPGHTVQSRAGEGEQAAHRAVQLFRVMLYMALPVCLNPQGVQRHE